MKIFNSGSISPNSSISTLGLAYDDILILPKRSEILSRNDTNLETNLTKNIKIKTPIISANMSSVTESDMAIEMALYGGVGFIHRFMTIEKCVNEIKKVKNYKYDIEKYKSASRDKNGKLLVGTSIGVRDNYIKNAEMELKAGADIIVIDIAHGHSIKAINAVKDLKSEFKDNIVLIIGNIATYDAAEEFIQLGVDALKVGIGPGSACSTRIVTGVGIPQITAIDEVYRASKTTDIPIIADGGIRNSGDISKALACGASTVMLGNLLARTISSSGNTIEIDGELFKEYKGEASRTEMNKQFKLEKRTNTKSLVPEGVEGRIPIDGTVEDTLNRLTGGIRSSMSYTNSRTLQEFRDNAEFIQITAAGFKESTPHDIIL
ncbi:MAG: IMP dehydrogenase [Patescibacteria group bacterium]